MEPDRGRTVSPVYGRDNILGEIGHTADKNSNGDTVRARPADVDNDRCGVLFNSLSDSIRNLFHNPLAHPQGLLLQLLLPRLAELVDLFFCGLDIRDLLIALLSQGLLGGGSE